MNRLDPDNNKPKEKPHVHILEAKFPTCIAEMDGFLDAIVASISDCAFTHKVPLAGVVCGLMSEDGAMIDAIKHCAETAKLPVGKTCMAAFASLGQKFFNAEIREMKKALMAEEMEFPTEEWMKKGDNKNFYSFQYYAFSMDKIQCDCPACIMFYCAKRSAQQIDIPKVMEEVGVACKECVERQNEHCITHKIPGGRDGEWLHLSNPESQ